MVNYKTCGFRFNGVILLAFIFYANAAHAQTCGNLKTPGFTSPTGDINIQYGDPLNIYCTINDSDEENGSLTSDNLRFYRNNETVQNEMVTKVNATTILLHISKPPKSKSTYYCKLTNGTVVCLNTVAVGTKPQNVTNFSCVGYNYDNLTCSWIAPQNNIKTKYTLFYSFPGRNNRKHYKCPKMNLPPEDDVGLMSCYWDIQTVPPYRQTQSVYYFFLSISNIFGNFSTKLTFPHFERVIPNPPEKLHVVNKTAESIFLNWTVSDIMLTFPPGLEVRILYQSEYDNEKEWVVADTSTCNKTNKYYFCNLTNLKYAHALYDIRVSMRSKKAKEKSMWSNFSSITVRTISKLPDEPPKTNIGSFENVLFQNNRDLFIYWQSIPDWKKNGEHFSYQITNIEEDGLKINMAPLEETAAYAKFRNVTFKKYKFDIVSMNEVGQSVNKSVINVPEYNPSKHKINAGPKTFTKIAFQQGLYELSWSPPNDHSEIQSYTIFWCNNVRDRPYQCTGLLNWTEIDSSVTTVNITVPDSEVYQFAISANTQNESSGMVWAACTVIHNKDISIMKSVGINHIDSTYIEVGWRLDCSDRIGSIKGFFIYYCPIKSPYSNSCKDAEKKIFVEGGEATRGIVTGLTPYTTYRLSVSLITTSNSSSLPSEPLFKTTLESAPGSPPRNISITNVTSHSITVSWFPPEAMNGFLHNYEVYYNSMKKPYIVESEKPTVLVLDKLSSYTNYSISLTACTVACSKPSIPIQVQTNMSYPDKMSEPYIKCINQSLILVRWRPPTIYRGNLEYFELRIKDSENDTNIINTTQLEVILPNYSDKLKVYFFSVRAVNVEGNLTLAGPWSLESQNYCPSSPSFIYLVIGFVVLIFFGLLFYAAKKAWQRYQIMRDVEVKLPPGLAMPSPNDIGMTQRSNTGLQKSQNDPKSHQDAAAADKEHLLTKKLECIESQDHISTGDSSGCSSGHESVTSSLASGTNYSSTSDSGTEQQSPSESSLRQRKTGSETLGWDSEIAWPNPKSGYVPSDKLASNWQSGKPSDYCVLGVDTTQPIDTVHGYVPVPVSAPHMETKPLKSAYVTCDSVFNKNEAPKSLMSLSGESPKKVPSSKYVSLKGSDTGTPYVLAGNSLIKPKPLEELISMEDRNEVPVGLMLETSDGRKGASVSSPYVQTGEPSRIDNPVAGYVKTDDILGLKGYVQPHLLQEPNIDEQEELPPGSYCRLGWDSSKPSVKPGAKSGTKASLLAGKMQKQNLSADMDTSASVPSASSDYLSHSAVQNKPDVKSYVPHRPYESKAFKED